jgi:hypothetical protein
MVSPVPLIPRDKEGFGSVTSHEENAFFIFEESRTFLFNQLAKDVLYKTILPKATIYTKKA